MEAKVTNLDNQAVGTIQLADEVFGVDPRVDLLQRMVVYQLARRQQGTHKTKTYGEVSYSTKKIV
ncbi:50S ribosomal protein L4, partial [Acinetobacter baumannii]